MVLSGPGSQREVLNGILLLCCLHVQIRANDIKHPTKKYSRYLGALGTRKSVI